MYGYTYIYKYVYIYILGSIWIVQAISLFLQGNFDIDLDIKSIKTFQATN